MCLGLKQIYVGTSNLIYNLDLIYKIDTNLLGSLWGTFDLYFVYEPNLFSTFLNRGVELIHRSMK